jgi:hypothetical protein
MLLFRSEEHANRWSERRGLPRGELVTLEQIWALAQRWYADVLSPDFRRPTPQEAQAFFDSIGLTGPFWQLRP